MRARCMELLADSARQTANKLKFFRIAFGAAGGFGDQVDPREAQAALEGLFGGDSLTNIHWLLGPALLSKTAIKVLLNMAMLGGDDMLHGGEIGRGAGRDRVSREVSIAGGADARKKN